MKPIPYGRQSIDQTDIDAVVETLKADFLTQGPKIKEFEDAFATYVGAQYAVAVSNGTAALHLANLALGVSKGDKVITTPITFAATANASRFVEADITFVDMDPKTLCIDIQKVKKLLETHHELKSDLLKILDKGGLIVVVSGAALITAYNWS